MKTSILALLCSLSTALAASGQVPSLINYQGRLTDANGAAVTGSKNFAINIYDAATGGNLLYSETIGVVILDTNGVYSFQFGSAGTSNTQVTETLATTNGTGTTFQKVLDNSPVVTGSVNVTDGTYTWSQSAGSSNEDEFGVAYSTSLRRITVNYYNGAPVSGRTITASYRYGAGGITGALSSGAEHWMAISVNGTIQASRQRVLVVPFAVNARKADVADSLSGGVDLKPFEEKQVGVVHQAQSAGFIVARFDALDALDKNNRLLEISVGETSNSMTKLYSTTTGYDPDPHHYTMPVPKNFYWIAERFTKVYFVSFK